MELTDNNIQFALWVQNRLEDKKADLGIAIVTYGDQNKIGATPMVCVEPGTKTRELAGAPRMTMVNLEVVLLIYLFKVGSTIQEAKAQVDILAEGIESFLHEKPECDGLVIHSMVNTVEYGYAVRDTSTVRAVRMTFGATSKVRLPYGGV
jgi:hypothetical protein